MLMMFISTLALNFKFFSQSWQQRVLLQPASLGTAQAPAAFLFDHQRRLSPFNWRPCLPSKKMYLLLLPISSQVRTIGWHSLYWIDFSGEKKTAGTATKGKETLTEMSRSIDSTKEL